MWQSAVNLFPEVAKREEFLRTLESWTDPGQPANTSVKDHVIITDNLYVSKALISNCNIKKIISGTTKRV